MGLPTKSRICNVHKQMYNTITTTIIINYHNSIISILLEVYMFSIFSILILSIQSVAFFLEIAKMPALHWLYINPAQDCALYRKRSLQKGQRFALLWTFLYNIMATKDRTRNYTLLNSIPASVLLDRYLSICVGQL